MLYAGRTLYSEIIVEPRNRNASFLLVIQNSVVRRVASQTVCIIVAGLAVVGTVWAELLRNSL